MKSNYIISFSDKIKFSKENLIYLKSNFELIKFNNLFNKRIYLKTKCLIVIPSTILNVEEISKFKNLQLVILMGLHPYNINTKFLKKKKIELIYYKKKYYPKINQISPTPEFIMGLILKFARNLTLAYDQINQNNWDGKKIAKNSFPKMIKNSSLGIIGMGRIGKILANYALSFDMKVFYYSPNTNVNNSKLIRCRSIYSVAEKSDFISINASLNNKTKRMIDIKFFKKMKKNSYFISTSRGEIVDENHLIFALKNNYFKGAAIDILTDEGQFISNPELIKKNKVFIHAKKYNNVFLFPHIAGSAKDAINYFNEKTIEIVMNKFKV